jgi:uncharacterized membrane protein YgcG
MDWFSKWRAVRHLRRSPYRAALAALPAGLEAHWRHSAPQEYPGIRTDAFFFARAAEGLMMFFAAARRRVKPCALPSEAADSVWHAWLRWNPIGLEQFCRRQFGGIVPHIERAGLGSGALANTLVTCRTLEGIATYGPALPALFGLDALLYTPRGHGYWTRHGEVVYARLGSQGVCLERAQPHPELTMGALVAAGLVHAEVLEAHLRRQQAADTTGSSCGGFGDAATCSDGGGDGGSGCGSGCGSSCGGGCGGGGGD